MWLGPEHFLGLAQVPPISLGNSDSGISNIRIGYLESVPPQANVCGKHGTTHVMCRGCQDAPRLPGTWRLWGRPMKTAQE